MPTTHTIEARFAVKGDAQAGRQPSQAELAQAMEDRVVAHMVQVLAGEHPSAANVVRLEAEARHLYRMIQAMHEALAKEVR